MHISKGMMISSTFNVPDLIMDATEFSINSANETHDAVNTISLTVKMKPTTSKRAGTLR